MATVIDSLVVSLGLDISSFTEDQRKAMEALKRFEDKSKRSNKGTKESIDSLSEAFEKVGKSILALGGISLGMASFRQFIGDMTTGGANVSRVASLLGMSAAELKAWGKVAETVGGNAEDMSNTFRNLQSNIKALQMGQGNQDFLTALAMLGIGGESWKNGKVNFLELAEAMKKFKEQYGEGAAMNIAERLGLNDTAFYLLIQGKEKLKDLYDQMEQNTKKTDEAAKAAERLQLKWGILKGEAGNLSDTIYSKLAPTLERVLDAMIRVFSPETKEEASTREAASRSTLATAAMGIDRMFRKMHGQGDVHTVPAIPSGTNQQAGDKRLPRNLRNNNPGNIEYGPYAKSKGAIGSDGRFAIFPTPQAGEKAMSDLLSSYRSRGYDTIASIIGRWSPASDNAAGNTASYISDVSRRTGIAPNQRLSDAQMFAVQHAMSLHEGGIGAATNASGGVAATGGTQVQTTINTLNVNTQATDANGMARDAYKALNDHAFIGAGLAGAQ